jgi:hypothetical protein
MLDRVGNFVSNHPGRVMAPSVPFLFVSAVLVGDAAALPTAVDKYSLVERSCPHIVVLKASSAGSTWFADTLSNVPGVHFKQQLLGTPGTSRHDISERVPAIARDLMRKSATMPCQGNVLVGFSQTSRVTEPTAPSYIPGFSFAFLRNLPDVSFITWTRSNVVLRAFSWLSFAHDGSTCTHNTKSAAAQQACAHQQYHVDRHRLLGLLAESACEYRARVLELGRELASPKAPLDLVYEDFARDQDRTMRLLFAYLQLPAAPLLRRTPSDLLKRSSNNVSTMHLNVAEVSAWLHQWSSPSAPLEGMYHDIEYTSFAQFDPLVMCSNLDGLRRACGALCLAGEQQTRASPQEVRPHHQ